MNGNVKETRNVAIVSVEPSSKREELKIASIIENDQSSGGMERVEDGISLMVFVSWPTKALCLVIDKTRTTIGDALFRLGLTVGSE